MSDAEVAEQVLSEHERTVLRHLRRRGLDSTLSLYRQYKDRGSLENAVRRMAEKVATARNRPTEDIGERDLADVLSDMTGMPVGQVLSAGLGRVNGAAAPALTPPVTGAAAPSPSSPPPPPAPAPASEPSPQPADDSSTRRRGANTASADRRRRIVELLTERPRSVKLLEHELDCAPHQVAHDLQVLKGEGKVEPTERSAHDWPGANRSAKASKLYRIPVAAGPTSDSGATIEGGNEEASSIRRPMDRQSARAELDDEASVIPTWPCGRCGRPGNTSDRCPNCGAHHTERGPYTQPPGIPAREAAEQIAAAGARLEQDATSIRVPSLRTHPVELDDSAPPPLAVEVAAARAIVAALDGLTPVEREKALHLALGARESAARLARYRMGVEAIELALPSGYMELAELVRRVLQDPS